MQLYAIYTSSHNPKVVGSNPSSATKFWGQNRCPSKNPGFSRVFFVFRRFSRFFENRKILGTKRCQSRFRGGGRDLNQISRF